MAAAVPTELAVPQQASAASAPAPGSSAVAGVGYLAVCWAARIHGNCRGSWRPDRAGESGERFCDGTIHGRQRTYKSNQRSQYGTKSLKVRARSVSCEYGRESGRINGNRGRDGKEEIIVLSKYVYIVKCCLVCFLGGARILLCIITFVPVFRYSVHFKARLTSWGH